MVSATFRTVFWRTWCHKTPLCALPMLFLAGAGCSLMASICDIWSSASRVFGLESCRAAKLMSQSLQMKASQHACICLRTCQKARASIAINNRSIVEMQTWTQSAHQGSYRMLQTDKVEIFDDCQLTFCDSGSLQEFRSKLQAAIIGWKWLDLQD